MGERERFRGSCTCSSSSSFAAELLVWPSRTPGNEEKLGY